MTFSGLIFNSDFSCVFSLAQRKLLFDMGPSETLSVFILVCFLVSFPTPTTQDTRGEPVNVGFICALPWDISNTLRAPIGGPVAVMLSAIFASILLFGFLLAPVYYFLGYPSRIYHPARQPGIISDYLYIDKERSLGDEGFLSFTSTVTSNLSTDAFQSRNFHLDEETTAKNATNADSLTYPDFLQSAFFLIAEEDVECRKLLLCHAHGFLQRLPRRVTNIIRFFSKRTFFIPNEYKSAVVLGLDEHNECINTYKCQKDLTITLKEMLYKFISSDIKSLWNLQKLF